MNANGDIHGGVGKDETSYPPSDGIFVVEGGPMNGKHVFCNVCYSCGPSDLDENGSISLWNARP